MQRVGNWSAACALVLTILAAAPAAAQIYVWKDPSGGVHFSDHPRHSGFTRHRLGPDPLLVARAARARTAWDPLIRRASASHGVPAGLIKAVIHAESAFDSTAVSPKGALGLMQLMPATAGDLGVDDPLDPWQNIEAGTRYLRYLMGRFPEQLPYALAAYNAGPQQVMRYEGVPPFGETRGYVRRVMRLYRRYDADFR
jgi:soluble lytic murein transglycosylase-like protein